MGKPSHRHFFQMSMFMCFINLMSRAEYSVQRASQYLKYFVSYWFNMTQIDRHVDPYFCPEACLYLRI
jgi:hypothetical protein